MQLARQIVRALPALIRVLRQAGPDHPVQRRRVIGCRLEMGAGSDARIAAIQARWLFPLKALWPVAIS